MSTTKPRNRVQSFAQKSLSGLSPAVKTFVENDGLWLVIGSFIAALGGMLSIKFLTQTLDPYEYGNIGISLSISGTFGLFLFGPIGQFVLRYFSIYRARGEAFQLQSILWLIFAAALFSLLALLPLLFFAQANTVLIVASLCLATIQGFTGFLSAVNYASSDRKIVVIHQGIQPWLNVAVVYGLYFVFGKSAIAAVVGFIVATVLVGFSQWRQTKSRAAGDAVKFEKLALPPKRIGLELWTYAWPFVVWSGVGSLSAYGDRWIINGVLGKPEVGAYYANTQIINAICGLTFGVLAQFLPPKLFATFKKGDASSEHHHQKVVNVSALLQFAILIPACVFTFFFGKYIAIFLTSVKYTMLSDRLWLLLFGVGLFNIGQWMSNLGMLYEKPKIYLPAKTLHGLSFVALLWFLTARFGLNGAVMGQAAAALLYVLAMAVTNRYIVSKYGHSAKA